VRRRELLLGLGGAAMWPVAALGQQAKVPTIGVLVLGNPDPGPFLAALREELGKLGYIEGQNFRLELRSAGGNAGALGDLAGELVRLKPDVIVGWQTPSATAAKQATSTIPIVMASVGEAVATGLVSNLARPGGNVTGNTAVAAEVMNKNVELIRETLPGARRVAVLANPVDPFTKPFLSQIELAAPALGIDIVRVMMNPTDNAEAYFEAMSQSKTDAVIIQPTLIRKDVIELALKHRLPSFSMVNSLTRAGGLMSYGAFTPDLWREAAAYVDKILKGARPADLPVAQPTHFELIVNLKTAKALGLTIPPSLLTRADEVIE
jgi:putative tryptophan/tyrosine transport system substrate-binding protein